MTVEEFEAFYAQAAGRLTGQLYVMLGDHHEAQDVVQEAFVRGWGRRRQLDREGRPEAWIRTVEALRQLPLKQRRTMALHYVCDLTVEQIAAETALSASTVKTHLSRGRATLSRHLQDPRIEEAPDA